ncbi:MAG TPA: TolC family protein [bacterium]|nr:TolC family protein [bacterium]
MARFEKLILTLAVLLLFTGCGAEYYRRSADKEAYRIIQDKSQAVEEMPAGFHIESATIPADATALFVPEELNLIDAVEIAVANSRAYQTRKENLYLQALSLSSSRHEFDPIFSGKISGDLNHDAANRESFSGILSTGVSKMLATGADLSAAISTSAFRYISSGDAASAAGTAFSAGLVQPLLKGAGRDVTLENLTQAEREMVYGIREFVRYRKSFSIGIAKRYYDLLQRADEIRNASRNYENLQYLRNRTENMAQAGRAASFEVDQAYQRELQAWDNCVRTQERYSGALDEFKLDLGIPTDLPIRLATSELEIIETRGLEDFRITVEEAVQTALEKRLDIKTQWERVEDAKRKVTVAKNNLKPRLDLILDYSAKTDASQPLDFGDGEDSYSVGADLDLPLDKKSDRNAYRRSLINLASAQRSLEQATDEVKLQVRDAYRALEQARQTYDIQRESLRLAQQRAESTQLLQQAGRAVTRDVLEAEQDLLDAKNALTRALIAHLNARLDLFIAMESLRIDEGGIWEEERQRSPLPSP